MQRKLSRRSPDRYCMLKMRKQNQLRHVTSCRGFEESTKTTVDRLNFPIRSDCEFEYVVVSWLISAPPQALLSGPLIMHALTVSVGYLIPILLCITRVLALSSSTNCPPRNQCDFGRLPGFWRDDEWPQWQVVDSCCRLEDLVGRSLSSPANYSHDEGVKASILIFGDSVERITLHDLCKSS